MIISRFAQLNAARYISCVGIGKTNLNMINRRLKTYYRSGALKAKPDTMPFGMVGVLCAVVPGLLIGAAISKNVANFLEENDLFVPSDDDDED